MTAISKLPEEVLLTILKFVTTPDLRNCLTVCRTWHLLCQKLLWKSIILTNHQSLDRFIAASDSDYNQVYQNFVKSIDVSGIYDHRKFDRQKLEKLLLRFPNLANLKFENSNAIWRVFDNQLREDLLKTCSKLSTFEIPLRGFYGDNYWNLLYQFRSLVTTITSTSDNFSRHERPVEYISSFSRLQEYHGDSNQSVTFPNFLPVFDSLADLKILALPMVETYDNLATSYLAPKSAQERNTVLQRLSKVRRLHLRCHSSFCINTMQFVKDYFDGLEYFSLESESNQNWTYSHRQIFSNDILELVCSMKGSALIHLRKVGVSTMSNCFPAVFQSLQERQPTAYTVFTLHLKVSTELFGLTIRNNNSSRNICMTAKKWDDDTLAVLDIPLNNVDEFRLQTRLGQFNDPDADRSNEDLSSFDKILKKMPLVKTVKMDLPPGYRDSAIKLKKIHPNVKSLAVRAAENSRFQNLLKKFPNITSLSLFYFCGLWTAHGALSIALQSFSLEKLTIDVTPVRRAMRVPGLQDMDFFVLQVETHKCRLYMVSRNLATVTRIRHSRLKGLTCGKDYVLINIKARKLELITLLMKCHAGSTEGYMSFDFHNSELLQTTFTNEQSI